MLDWFYRALFARRATWLLEKGESRISIVIYDPSPECLDRGNSLAYDFADRGWEIVEAPKEVGT